MNGIRKIWAKYCSDTGHLYIWGLLQVKRDGEKGISNFNFETHIGYKPKCYEFS